MRILFMFLVLSLFASSCSHFSPGQGRTPSSESYPYALFSPTKGEEAFNEIYKNVKKAEEYVHATIYSWSDSGIDKAFLEALKGGAHFPFARGL